jgi:uncharacterized protein (TIGR03067 family)
MSRSILGSIALVLLLSQNGPSFGGGMVDFNLLQGNWKLVKMDGPPPVTPIPNSVMNIQGGSFKIELNGNEITNGTFRIDPTKNPKHIDLRVDKSPNPKTAKQVLPGIYQIQGNQLIMCLNENPGGPGMRPTAFVPQGLTQMVITFEQMK